MVGVYWWREGGFLGVVSVGVGWREGGFLRGCDFWVLIGGRGEGWFVMVDE